MSEQSTDQLIEKYLQHCKFEKGLSGKTLKAYRIDLNQFSTYLNDSSALTCGKEDIQRYLSILKVHYERKDKIISEAYYQNERNVLLFPQVFQIC